LTSSDDANVALITLLAKQEPGELLQVALVNIAALIVQHDALRHIAYKAIKEQPGCLCEKCQKYLAEGLEQLSLVERDLQKLVTAVEMLEFITSYKHPGIKAVEEAAAIRYRNMQIGELEECFKASGDLL
jgi:hypothetical protein